MLTSSSLFPVQLKYIFPAGGLLKSSLNTFVKKRDIKELAIFADLEEYFAGLL